MKDVAISSDSGNDSKKFQRGAANNNRIQAQTSGDKKRIESLQRLAGVHGYHSNRHPGQPPPTLADRGLSESLRWRASMGSRRAARRAGRKPKTTPRLADAGLIRSPDG